MRHPTTTRVLALMLVAAAAGCGGRTTVVKPAPLPRAVSLHVEVYDPATDFVWEGVGVRIVEVEHEWSNLIVEHPKIDDWSFTDPRGTVLYTSSDLAAMRLGFVESAAGHAVIDPDLDADEAYVLIELAAPGFPVVRTEVHVTWEEPDLVVSIPFSPLPEQAP